MFNVINFQYQESINIYSEMHRERSLGNILYIATLSPANMHPKRSVYNQFFPSSLKFQDKKQNSLHHHQFSSIFSHKDSQQGYFSKQKKTHFSKIKKGNIKINISGKDIVKPIGVEPNSIYQDQQKILKTTKQNAVTLFQNVFSPIQNINKPITNFSNVPITPQHKNCNVLNATIKGSIASQAKKHKLLKKQKARNQGSSNAEEKREPAMQFNEARTLGSGQFGSVTMVQHTATKTIYAIKRIRIKNASSKLIERVCQQIKIQMYLDHQNCLKIYKAYRQLEDIILLLQLGQGSLFDLLRQKKFLNQKQAALYLRQIIKALKYMHSEGVIHRDIKPENIVLVNGCAKLADFGWSIYTNKKKRTTFCGTLDYVSPQLVVGSQYDQMVDVWSVGVLCYELCTGHAPFECQQNVNQTYQKILGVELKYPKHLSLAAKSFISKLLMKNPSSRMSLDDALRHPWMIQFQEFE